MQELSTQLTSRRVERALSDQLGPDPPRSIGARIVGIAGTGCSRHGARTTTQHTELVSRRMERVLHGERTTLQTQVVAEPSRDDMLCKLKRAWPSYMEPVAVGKRH